MEMFRTTATTEEIIKKVADFLSDHLKIDRIILYGSYARGDFRKDSDFDIAVISRDLEKKDILEKIELFSKASIAVDSRVELKGFGRNEFLNPEKGSLLEMIKKQGKVVWRQRA